MGFGWLVVAAVLWSQVGCRAHGDVSGRLVPRWWLGNPWGPKAEQARLRGVLPPVPDNPRVAAWQAWGRANLREGDILFRLGAARAAFGLFCFSKITATMADSDYSHTGIVAWEEGEPFVYDTAKHGPRRQPFGIWVLDTAGSLAARRPRAEYQGYVPSAVAFVRDVYCRQVPFDLKFEFGDDRFYCVEMTERAYRTAGLTLSEPIQIDQLPRFHEYPKITWLVRTFSTIRFNHAAFVIGNDRLGLWSSPALEPVFETPKADWPPGFASTVVEQTDATSPPPPPRPAPLAGLR